MNRQNEPIKSHESFKATIDFVKSKIQAAGNDITDAEIGHKLNIPMSTYYEYLEMETVPGEIFDKLRHEFKNILHGTRFNRASFNFEVDLPDPED
jgi:hypothetical protein